MKTEAVKRTLEDMVYTVEEVAEIMKTSKQYVYSLVNAHQLRVCGTEYNDKTKAQHCEKGHCKPLEIIKARYLSVGNNAKGYPLEITVKMADGTEQKYKR